MNFLEFMIKYTNIYQRNSLYFILLQDNILNKNKCVGSVSRPLVFETWSPLWNYYHNSQCLNSKDRSINILKWILFKRGKRAQMHFVLALKYFAHGEFTILCAWALTPVIIILKICHQFVACRVPGLYEADDTFSKLFSVVTEVWLWLMIP